ncbi:hypothetical protein F444_22565, partial [Phytophthora nicotianae P1976]
MLRHLSPPTPPSGELPTPDETSASAPSSSAELCDIVPKKHLVVYADNCSGQNKNNHVIRFFLAQVQYGTFERVDYKFFVKGHTKNSCDRGFGHIRKR